MKTKITILALLITGVFSTIQAQDCASDFSIFVEYAKNKNYESAYTPWQKTRKECPKYHKATYIFGERILEFKIENAKTPADKKAQIEDLIKMYDEYDANFPDNGNGNKTNKALLLMDNNIGTADEHYTMLDKAYQTEKDNFTAKAVYAYFSLYVDQYNAGNKGVELQQIFDKYDDLNDVLASKSAELEAKKDELILKQETTTLTQKEERNFSAYETNIEAYEKVTTSMDAKIGLLSNCDRLVPFYEKNFEARKKDAIWLERAAQRLDSKDCSKEQIFVKISEALHQLNPTAESAYNLGIASRNANNTNKAIEYFEQAASLQTDSTKKAKIYYQVATLFSSSNPSKSKSFALKALQAKPSYGRSYLLIAQLYGNSVNQCGNNPFEKRAVNWLAAQMAEKAGRVDSSLRSQASAAADSYRQRAPSKTDIFQSAMQGKTIRFNCWIGESITVPSL